MLTGPGNKPVRRAKRSAPIRVSGSGKASVGASNRGASSKTKPVRAQRQAPSQARDTKGDADRAPRRTSQENAATRRAVRRAADQGARVGRQLEQITRTPERRAYDAIQEKVAKPLANAKFRPETKKAEGPSPAIPNFAKAARNAGPDAADIVTGFPVGAYHLGKTAVTDPKKLPGMLAKPYKDTFLKPGGLKKAFEESPVSLAAMVAPPLKAGSMTAGTASTIGKVGKTGAKHGLTATRTVPHTPIKIADAQPKGVLAKRKVAAKDAAAATGRPARRPLEGAMAPLGERGVRKAQRVRNAAAAVKGNRTKEKGGGPIVATRKDLLRATDEFEAMGRKAVQDRVARTVEEAKKNGVKKGAELDKVVDDAHKTANQWLREERARQFGATVKATPTMKARVKAGKELNAAFADVRKARVVRNQARKDAARARKTRHLETQLASATGRHIPSGEGPYFQIGAKRLDARLRDTRASVARLKREQDAARRRARTMKSEAGRARWQAKANEKGYELGEARRRARRIERDLRQHNVRARGVPDEMAQVVVAAEDAMAKANKAWAAKRHGKMTADDAHRNYRKNPLATGNANAAQLFDSKHEASLVARALREQPGWEQGAVVRSVGKDKYAVLPQVIARRSHSHQKVGTSPATMAVALRGISRPFSSTVLALSPTFHAGNALEGTMRAATAGAGPGSLRFANKVLNQLPPEVRADLLAHSVPGGRTKIHKENASGAFAADMAQRAKALDNTGTQRFFQGVEDAKEFTGFKAAGRGWRKVTDKSFDVSAHRIERPVQTAMLGKHLKDTWGSVENAVKALEKRPEARYAAGREVRKMYGSYNVFSPAMRENLMHWAPFAPWSINAAKFPRMVARDHPVAAGVAANTAMATREEREKNGQAFTGNGEKRPFYQRTAIQLPNGKFLKFGQYTPLSFWAQVLGDDAGPVSGLSRQLLPQVGPLVDLSRNVDYKNKTIREPWLTATARGLRNQAAIMSGPLFYADKGTSATKRLLGEKHDPLGTSALKLLWPFEMESRDNEKKGKKAKKRRAKKRVVLTPEQRQLLIDYGPTAGEGLSPVEKQMLLLEARDAQ